MDRGRRTAPLVFRLLLHGTDASDGSPDSTQCIAERVRIQLPCDGISYRLGIKTETPVPILEANESRIPFWLYKNLGTVGNYIRLVGIRHMIRK